MTTYTKRDIRAADMLAMILFGFGAVLVLFSVCKTTDEVGKQGGSVAGTWIIAAVFLALGTALNLKVRQLVRTNGMQPGRLRRCARRGQLTRPQVGESRDEQPRDPGPSTRTAAG